MKDKNLVDITISAAIDVARTHYCFVLATRPVKIVVHEEQMMRKAQQKLSMYIADELVMGCNGKASQMGFQQRLLIWRDL